MIFSAALDEDFDAKNIFYAKINYKSNKKDD